MGVGQGRMSVEAEYSVLFIVPRSGTAAGQELLI
jgi:hypothetical protein